MALGVFPLELCGGLWVMGDHDLAATPLCSVRWCGRDGPPMQPAADQSASQLRFGDAFSSITHDSMALDNGGRVNRADARLLRDYPRDYPRAEPIPNPTPIPTRGSSSFPSSWALQMDQGQKKKRMSTSSSHHRVAIPLPKSQKAWASTISHPVSLSCFSSSFPATQSFLLTSP